MVKTNGKAGRPPRITDISKIIDALEEHNFVVEKAAHCLGLTSGGALRAAIRRLGYKIEKYWKVVKI